MKVVLIGSNGQLGSDIVRTLSLDKTFKLISFTHKDIEVTDNDSINKVFNHYKPDLVINTSAFHKVESCEKEIENSFNVNTYAVRNLSLYCKEKDITLVHFSTDYVFGLDENRKKPYKETDTPGPVNTYGISKLSGEYFIRYLLKKYFLIRTTGLFGEAGSSGKGGNFVEAMVKKEEGSEVRMVNDQTLCPTSTSDLAENLKSLIKTKDYGLYHMVSQGHCNWYEFAKEIFMLTNKNVDLKPISSKESGSTVKRPAFSALENAKLKEIKLNQMHHWKESLKEYLQRKKYLYLR